MTNITSPQLLPVLATTLILAASTIAAYGYHKSSSRRKRLGVFPTSSPWFMPFADLVRIIRAGTFEQFIKDRKAALKSDAFYMHLLGFSQLPTLVVTEPADFVDIMHKEGKLNLCVQMPDTVKATHGPGNLQLLSGVRHNFLRKIFAKLLHPNTLERFLPYFYEEFTKMWAKLDEADGEVIIQDAICEAQFFLMAKILYGMTPENTDLDTMRQLQHDFDLQMKGHFASPKSKTFRDAKEASQSIRRVLNPMFDAVLDKRRHLMQTGDVTIEATHDDLPVGNAMESIADALLKDNVQDDEQIRSDVYDNLNLLLEASHGTTSELNCHYYQCIHLIIIASDLFMSANSVCHHYCTLLSKSSRQCSFS
jgi:cytochrome P450